ncbi:MAG: hypothetical protein L6R39_007026 [Caloplaca ligustica]|nr:MAG: hypothetical protein L6R39_007026 [Caloplaca ligustica]
MRRVLLSSARCASYRAAVLDAFINASGLRLPPSSYTCFNRLSPETPSFQHPFSTVPRSRSELVSWTAAPADAEGDQASESLSNSKDSKDSEPLPWYLQVQTPQQERKSLSNRQLLPDIPADSPPLLQPMLEHISIDLGLDDLSLLDLRDIDPPPALGANLMMILGTARSEKHLHVSADRFCRWLRTTHKLSPYADGLLGRGELRLKLKRKNRRARMLNSVGASDSSNTDDGIRTGWVCVNIGSIEDGRALGQESMDAKDDDYVGFSSESSGVKMVVQMLTEEKRDELDLETFWGKALGRYTRKRDRIAMAGEQSPSSSDIAPASLESSDVSSTSLPVN